MKKLLALLLATVMLLSMTACGTPSKPEELEDISDEDWQAAAEALEEMYAEEPATEPEPTEPEEQIYEVGDTFLTPDGMLEITISDVCFSDYWGTGDVPGDGSTHSGISEEEVYLYYKITLNFVGDNKVEYNYYMANATADYNNGYTFNSSARNVYDVGDIYGQAVSARFEPLAVVKVKEIRSFFRVPDIVETDTESPLLLKFELIGKCVNSKETIPFTVRVR